MFAYETPVRLRIALPLLVVTSGVSLGTKFISILPRRFRMSPLGKTVALGYHRRPLIVGPELQVFVDGSKISVVARPLPASGAGSSPPPDTNTRPSGIIVSPLQKMSSLMIKLCTLLVFVLPLGIVTT